MIAAMRRIDSSLLLVGLVAITSGACGRSLDIEDGEDGGAGGSGSVSVVGPSSGTGSAQGGSTSTSPTGAGGDGTVTTSGPTSTTGSANGGAGPGTTGSANGGAGPVGPGPGPGPGAGGAPPDTVTVGPGQGPSGAGGASQVCNDFGDDCTGCISQECPERWCDCAENPECLAYFECTNGCSTNECFNTCAQQHSGGVSDAGLVLDCAGDSCQQACPGAEPLDPCTECFYEDCGDENDACTGEPDCWALYGCLIDCGPNDLNCQADCYDDHEAGIDPLQAVFECLEEECQNVCGF
jgi:hypothetical protein